MIWVKKKKTKNNCSKINRIISPLILKNRIILDFMTIIKVYVPEKIERKKRKKKAMKKAWF